ncbi:hypothetical protein BC936DRAFT_149687 [Jimgerdemannia flammicorona]|uniref:Chitin-binding type-4 domain-containing protein n=1 Tax=Jimgerdemannia flammicorona TaxID=994334 RepID=A0A433D0B8_9FUNG|nr:hypothetical protein BC936DRAFT_149687 [Jimgerdemannia flammicorona]
MAKLVSLLTTFVALSSCIATISAHMAIRDPPTRRSLDSSYYQEAHCVSNNLVTPLTFQGKFTYPCRGFAPGPALKTWTAGRPVSVEMIPSANHGGGHCELAISYDNVNFAVIYQSFDTCHSHCVQGDRAACTLNFTLPVTLPPSPSAVLAWSWIAHTGNREYFHGCSDIQIVAPAASRKRSRKSKPNTKVTGGFTGPRLTVANYPGYPVVFEFNSTYNGIQVYHSQPQITITAPPNAKAITQAADAISCPLPAVPIGDLSKLSKTLPVAGTACTSSQPSRCVNPGSVYLDGLLFIACDGQTWQQSYLSAGLLCVQTEKGIMGYSQSAGDLTADNNW